jgi:sec-independent protein translocase protein TatA
MMYNIFFFNSNTIEYRDDERSLSMGFLGGQELLVILIIVILLFGAKKIPELAKGLGTGIKEFKKASNEADKQLNVKDDVAKNDDPPKEKEGTHS